MFIYSDKGLLWRAKGKTRRAGDVIDCPEADRIATANGYWCAENIVKDLSHLCIVELDDVTLKVKGFFKTKAWQKNINNEFAEMMKHHEKGRKV
jgi:hypothetical protein